MCGIAGILALAEDAPPVEREELLRIREAMARRGPDGSGLWIAPGGRIGLAHRRLAIIDLSESGAQPMQSADARLHIVFNGEIYNYRELRAELAAAGRQFRSSSDTEVLLHLYELHGAAMVARLRGMFAFAVWDARERTLFLARDPFGIKPLYYCESGGTLRFASQVKALRAGSGVSSAPDHAGHVGFFVLGSVPEPHTLFRDIRALPAGHTLAARAGGRVSLERYFDVGEEMTRATARPGAVRDKQAVLGEALRDSVRHHMIADVPVGLFLSSGLDSSTVAALARESEQGNLGSITLGFDEYRNTADDEVPLAATTARHLGTSHAAHWITRAGFEAELERLMQAMDQPSIDGVNTYFVSKAAVESGMKVALSGLGGDELFGGYPELPRRAVAHPRVRMVGRAPARRALVAARRRAAGGCLLLAQVREPARVRRLLRRRLPAAARPLHALGARRLHGSARRRARLGGARTPRALRGRRCAAWTVRASAWPRSRCHWYMRNQLLRDADWAGMAHSLEIRVPFVDVEVFRAVAALIAGPDPPTKLDAARTPATALPAAIMARRKTGFSIPVHDWAKHARMARGPQRQLRNWAHVVHRPYKRLRVLMLLSDAYGGHGGIALYNRDLVASLCAIDEVSEVVALPRLVGRSLEPLPGKLTYVVAAANGKARYVWSVLRLLARDSRFDVVLCCHVNLLPISALAKAWLRVPLMLFIYGIDAWRPQPFARRLLLGEVDRFVSISDVTRRKFIDWSKVGEDKIAILPNAIHADWYGPGGRDPELVRRYGLQGRVVLMTLGRLVSSERYKGFDEVLDALPALAAEDPQLVYLIVGDGSDRRRLERKAAELGVAGHVRFTGMIPESEKADHYRLADAYVMPSRGEGFGFVLLEAMACGIPAVASALDGGREAVRHGELGILVDPGDLEDVKRGIREALARGKGAPPAGLDFFDFRHFEQRTRAIIQDAVRARLPG